MLRLESLDHHRTWRRLKAAIAPFLQASRPAGASSSAQRFRGAQILPSSGLFPYGPSATQIGRWRCQSGIHGLSYRVASFLCAGSCPGCRFRPRRRQNRPTTGRICRLTGACRSGSIPPTVNAAKNQFSLTRAAANRRGGKKAISYQYIVSWRSGLAWHCRRPGVGYGQRMR